MCIKYILFYWYNFLSEVCIKLFYLKLFGLGLIRTCISNLPHIKLDFKRVGGSPSTQKNVKLHFLSCIDTAVWIREAKTCTALATIERRVLANFAVIVVDHYFEHFCSYHPKKTMFKPENLQGLWEKYQNMIFLLIPKSQFWWKNYGDEAVDRVTLL